MSIVLSMYSMSAFREVVLMDRGNPKMQIMIEKKLFGLRRDVLLHGFVPVIIVCLQM